MWRGGAPGRPSQSGPGRPTGLQRTELCLVSSRGLVHAVAMGQEGRRDGKKCTSPEQGARTSHSHYISHRSSIRDEVFILAPRLRVLSITDGEGLAAGAGVAWGHCIQSGSREMDTATTSVCLFRLSLGSQPTEWRHPHLGWVFPPQLT